tara:strand:- start:688 stop:927 length:240 start_codon:yes stop_codon:yes gene_type:complete
MHTPLKFFTLPDVFFENLYQDAEQVLLLVVIIVLLCFLGVAHPPIWAQPFGASSSWSQGACSAAGSSGGAVATSILVKE